jgi:hypothetical protein
LGRDGHCSSVVGCLGFQQEPILCCFGHTDLDGLLVCGFVPQRQTARTPETVSHPTSSLTVAKSRLHQQSGSYPFRAFTDPAAKTELFLRKTSGRKNRKQTNCVRKMCLSFSLRFSDVNLAIIH